MQVKATTARGVPSVAERRAALAARNPEWRSETLDRAFARIAHEFRDRPYVLTDDLQRTYGEVAAKAEAFARGLAAVGVRAGDHVGLTMANHPVFIPIAFAVWRLGAVLIPLNFAFRTQELAYVVEQSRCRVLITMDTFRQLDYLAMLDELAPGWERDARSRFPMLETVVVHGVSRPGVLTVEEVFDHGGGDAVPLRPSPARATDIAVILYTSGTTGSPKGVQQSHDAVLRSAYGIAHHRAYQDGWRTLFALPLYHTFALVIGVLSPLWVGGAVIPQLMFDPVGTFAGIERHRATDALFVPTMVMSLLEHPDAGQYDFSSMVAVLSGAAPTPVRAWQQLIDLFGLAEVVTGYGMTELAGSTALTEPGDPLTLVETTVGRVVNGGVAGIAALGGAGRRVSHGRSADRHVAWGGRGGRVRLPQPVADLGLLRLARADGGAVPSGGLGPVG